MAGARVPLSALVICALLSCRVVVSSDIDDERPPAAEDEITLEREQIFVRFENVTTFGLMMEPDDSVQDLKVDLREYEGVPWDIRLQLDDTHLRYDSKLSDHNIKAGATVTLMLDGDRGHQTIKLTIRTRDGRELPIVTYLDNTIANIKDIITQLSGIPQAEQRLLLNGKELKDERKMALYRIYNETEINLGKPLKDCQGQMATISVRTLSGAAIEVEVDLADTVRELKEEISRKTGIPVGAQRLFIDDCAITGEDHLCDLGLEDGFTLYMFLYSSRITSLEQIARLCEEPTRVNPDKGPIFREVKDASEPAHRGRSLFRDARNWIAHSIPRPDYPFDMYDSVAYWAPDPDDEQQIHSNELTLAWLAKVATSDSDRLNNRIARAQIKLSLAVRPYRVAAHLTQAKHVRQHSAFMLGGGFTYPNRRVPLGGDINNWTPDAFSDADVMRLFEVSERVRQVLASDERILPIDSQRRINRAILMTYLGALAGVPLAAKYDQSGGGVDCGICHDDLTVEAAIKLACEHTFHVDCILSWVTNSYQNQGSARCPFCRQKIVIPYEVQGKAELEKPELQDN